MREIRSSGSMRGGELFAHLHDGQLPAYSTGGPELRNLGLGATGWRRVSAPVSKRRRVCVL